MVEQILVVVCKVKGVVTKSPPLFKRVAQIPIQNQLHKIESKFQGQKFIENQLFNNVVCKSNILEVTISTYLPNNKLILIVSNLQRINWIKKKKTN